MLTGLSTSSLLATSQANAYSVFNVETVHVQHLIMLNLYNKASVTTPPIFLSEQQTYYLFVCVRVFEKEGQIDSLALLF